MDKLYNAILEHMKECQEIENKYDPHDTSDATLMKYIADRDEADLRLWNSIMGGKAK